MTAIAYDRPVKDLIAQLNATGHVTHEKFTKTSVTLHHNGGNLSHEDVLNTWKTREASAHFDVDSSGAVAQFVDVNEYAWAVGNTAGNQSSISIEMANSSLGPEWQVAQATWEGGARLAGWLFAHVVKARPTASNFFVHHHWSSTACAGPYIDSIFPHILIEAQAAYDTFTGVQHPAPPVDNNHPTTPAPKPQLALDGQFGPKTIQKLQQVIGVAADGIYGPATKKALQRWLGVAQDGIVGPQTIRALQARVGASQDGLWGVQTTIALQRYLNAH